MALSPAQQAIVDSPQRFCVAVCGRRFGKTHLAIRQLCYYAKEPNREVWYVAPSYRAAKMIAWKKLKRKLEDLKWVKKVNESELTLLLKNGSTISLKGADNHDSLRGIGLDFLVMDEFADIDPEAWYETLRPTLADKQGKALFIGTPKGLNWAHDLYQKEIEDPKNWKSFTYTTIDGGNVPEEEIEAAKRDMNEKQFNQEFLATFETYSGRCFYNFDRKTHVKVWTEPVPSTLYLGIDFNIDPMTCVILAQKGELVHVIDEIRMYSSNTQELVEEIRSRYPFNKIWAMPDPASRQRKTSAGGSTDFIQLQNAGFIVKAPHRHEAVRDGLNIVNSRLLNVKKQINLFVDPKCKATIEMFERYTYKEGTSVPDKDSGYDHMADALRYAVSWLYGIERDTSSIAQPRRWGHQVA